MIIILTIAINSTMSSSSIIIIVVVGHYYYYHYYGYILYYSKDIHIHHNIYIFINIFTHTMGYFISFVVRYLETNFQTMIPLPLLFGLQVNKNLPPATPSGMFPLSRKKTTANLCLLMLAKMIPG